MQSAQRMKECIGRMLRPLFSQSMDSIKADRKSDKVALQSDFGD